MFNNVQRGANMATSILRLPTVCKASGKSRSTIYLRIKDGLFPPAVSIGARAVGWPAEEIDAINRAHIAGKSDDDIRRLVATMVVARKATA